jgi:hypothetical protein
MAGPVGMFWVSLRDLDVSVGFGFLAWLLVSFLMRYSYACEVFYLR